MTPQDKPISLFYNIAMPPRKQPAAGPPLGAPNPMTAEAYGLLPVRCYTCGREIGHYQEDLEAWIGAGGDLEGFYDFYGVPLEKRKALEKWLDQETDYVEQTTQALQTLLVETQPQYLDQFKAINAKRSYNFNEKINWGDRVFMEGAKPLALTLEQRFNAWMHGDPVTQKVLLAFIDFLETHYLSAIYTAMKVPKKDQAIITERLKYGLGARGFQIKEGLRGFTPCCRWNLRPPAKILH